MNKKASISPQGFDGTYAGAWLPFKAPKNYLTLSSEASEHVTGVGDSNSSVLARVIGAAPGRGFFVLDDPLVKCIKWKYLPDIQN